MNRATLYLQLGVWMLAAFLLGGCESRQEESAEAQMVPTKNELKNMTYRSAVFDSGTVRLTNGTFADPMGAGAFPITVTLTGFQLTGFLNDRQEGAVVVLRSAVGESGVFYDLAAVLKDSSGVHNVALASLGDRVKITSLTIEDHRIHLQMTTHTPLDLPCCPTIPILNTYVLRADKLVLLKSQPAEE